MAKEKKTYPQQKTFEFGKGESPQKIDTEINKWIKDLFYKDARPTLDKFYIDPISGIKYFVYLYIHVE